MAGLPAEARELIESDALAHLVTLNPDGSPQVTCIWVDVQGHELVSAHLMPEQQRIGGFGPWAGQ
jgi:predicted pyridoxine 5'-phosphate oxidase superfamily flavin-nucleotide-binding protein